MKARLIAVVVVLGVTLGGGFLGARSDRQASGRENHVAWVSDVLKQMQTIKPGMTRSELLTVFTTEGGLSTSLQRTFVSRDCPYFKVDVQFEAAGRPAGSDFEGKQDRIVKISRPYLQFSVIN